jgi:hypothetical protein
MGNMLLLAAVAALAGSGIKVMVDGDEIDFGNRGKPMIKDKRVLVPLRGVMEKLGAQVTFDADELKITAVKNNRKIELWAGSRHAMVNDEEVMFDTALAVENGRVMVPLRFLSEQLDGAKVHWDKAKRTVTISSK